MTFAAVPHKMYKYSVETMSLYTHTEERKMFITAIIGWVKSLVQSYEKPRTYGSALEAYIVANHPQDASDVDRLTREFDQKNRGGFVW